MHRRGERRAGIGQPPLSTARGAVGHLDFVTSDRIGPDRVTKSRSQMRFVTRFGRRASGVTKSRFTRSWMSAHARTGRRSTRSLMSLTPSNTRTAARTAGRTSDVRKRVNRALCASAQARRTGRRWWPRIWRGAPMPPGFCDGLPVHGNWSRVPSDPGVHRTRWTTDPPSRWVSGPESPPRGRR